MYLLCQEIDRVLRVGGRYICVSLLQEHILVKLLEFFPTAGWMFRVCRCIEAEQRSARSGDGAGLPVFIVICTKFKKLPNVQPVSSFFTTEYLLLLLKDSVQYFLAFYHTKCLLHHCIIHLSITYNDCLLVKIFCLFLQNNMKSKWYCYYA